MDLYNQPLLSGLLSFGKHITHLPTINFADGDIQYALWTKLAPKNDFEMSVTTSEDPSNQGLAENRRTPEWTYSSVLMPCQESW